MTNSQLRLYPPRFSAGSSPVVLGDVRTLTGSRASTTNITSIAVTITRQRDDEPTLDDSLAVAAVIYNSAHGTVGSEDPRWDNSPHDADGAGGFNFEHKIDAAAFPERDFYRITYEFTQSDGRVFKLWIETPAGSE